MQHGVFRIEALMRPEAFAHPVSHFQLLETHISWVILTGEYAYKIKKPVDLGFLDFSTLEKRKHYCGEEVRLNQRLAPDYYLGVVKIAVGGDQLRMEGQGHAVEYAVKMRQFPRDVQLDALLPKGELQAEYMDDLARLIADFHAHIPVADDKLAHGSPSRVYQPVAENFSQIDGLIRDAGTDAALEELRRWSEQEFAHRRALMGERKKRGYIRECHGDMHLGNMAWVDGRPLVFDCIEFNPGLRWIDVISEAAFLVMDLIQRGQPALAWRFLNAYLEQSGDYAGVALLPFYLVYRAMVRAKIAAIRSHQTDIGASGKLAAEKEFADYLDLAGKLSQQRTPVLMITHGVSASGKSTVSSLLLEQLGAIRIRSDVERKRLFGIELNADAGAAPGQGIYDAGSSEKTYAVLLRLAGQVLDAGYPVIVDAAFLKFDQRLLFEELAVSRCLPFVILDMQVSDRVLRERIQKRKKGVSDADPGVLEHQLQSREMLRDEERSFVIGVDTENDPDMADVLSRIRQLGDCYNE